MKESKEIDLRKELGLTKENFRTQIMELEKRIKNII